MCAMSQVAITHAADARRIPLCDQKRLSSGGTLSPARFHVFIQEATNQKETKTLGTRGFDLILSTLKNLEGFLGAFV